MNGFFTYGELYVKNPFLSGFWKLATYSFMCEIILMGPIELSIPLTFMNGFFTYG